MDLVQTLTDLGGLAHRGSIAASDRELTAGVRSGEIRRVRRGWYTILPPSDPRARCREIGGRLTGALALRLQGAWMWRDPPLEVSVSRNAARLGRHPPSVTVHYDLPEVHARGEIAVVDCRDALVHAIRRLPFEEAVSTLDWALHTERIDDGDLAWLRGRLPRHLARITEWCDRHCESFIESVVRTRLRLARLEITSQRPLPGSLRIDLVVNGVVAIEVDGREFHESSFEQDRRKDLAITLDGKHALRLTYALIRDEWPRVLAAIEAALEFRRMATRLPSAARFSRPHSHGRHGPWALEPPER
ncbi:hypothetical protein [Frondihabitans sp. PAMC 28766]|uniref:hypothetical protein n=1 Tax=Frondihabitans sp. PAMC 28766 TaxID=1795630 RepID=UPI0012FF7E25|nr:hypothetical protein [Frondihabitans sp. PAMC 28766]